MPGYSKPFHVKIHECVLVTLDDAFNFSEALRAEFRRIRFVREDYADKFFDFAAWQEACRQADLDRRPSPRRLDFARDPGNELPDYFPSLADVLETRFRVWVEPPNWRPRWRLRKRDDFILLDNQPGYVRAADGALQWALGLRHNYLSWDHHWFKPERYFHWLRPSDD